VLLLHLRRRLLLLLLVVVLLVLLVACGQCDLSPTAGKTVGPAQAVVR
jgi:hypothetical protein